MSRAVMHSCTSILRTSHDLKIADVHKTLDDELQFPLLVLTEPRIEHYLPRKS